MNKLYETLRSYCDSDYYPFHMPGHKRNLNFFPEGLGYGMDITEIEGFDYLHDAKGIIKDSMDRAAQVFGAEESYFLVNGSSCGLLAGISACTKAGDKIIMARNSHKSAYHGVFLNQLDVQYSYPHFVSNLGINGGIYADNIEKMLITHTDTKLVLITSPTYEGIVSDIEAIAIVCHNYNIPLIVDQAHGAHLGFSQGFPKSAVQLGADIVIESLHKTLPSFTQTAILHLNGTLVDRKEIRKYLEIYQTSSPSYVFMAGMDYLVGLLEKEKANLFRQYEDKLTWFYHEMQQLKKLFILKKEDNSKYYTVDFSKIVIFTQHTDLNGQELYEILLNQYHLQMEMVSTHYVIAMTSICDTEEGIKRLADALLEIDQTISMQESSDKCSKSESISGKICLENLFMGNRALNQVCTIFEADCLDGEAVLLEESINRISKEYLYLYPPGMPLLVPGEKINRTLINCVKEYLLMGLEVKGLQDILLNKIIVVKK